LVDAKAEDMRQTSPLKENGPDPVIDKDILTVDWLSKKLRSKKVPVKALLLDQVNILNVKVLEQTGVNMEYRAI
jgi:formamidopyrimidine-DNA glycosylase